MRWSILLSPLGSIDANMICTWTWRSWSSTDILWISSWSQHGSTCFNMFQHVLTISYCCGFGHFNAVGPNKITTQWVVCDMPRESRYSRNVSIDDSYDQLVDLCCCFWYLNRSLVYIGISIDLCYRSCFTCCSTLYIYIYVCTLDVCMYIYIYWYVNVYLCIIVYIHQIYMKCCV